MTDPGELDYLVRDTRLSATLVGAPAKCELGHILTYYDGSQPQFAHLRASMLAYAHINLLSMLQRFEPDEVVRVATDSIYVGKTALYKLEGVGAYKPPEVHPEGYCHICLAYHDKATSRPPRNGIAPAQWRNKGESLYMPMEHAAYLAGPDYKATKKDLPPSAVPPHDDALSWHQLSYLSGGGGSGKTTRAIKLFCTRNPLVFTPTCLLAKEMRAWGFWAQTYHSFFCYTGVKHARATEEDLVLLQSKPEYLGKTLKVFRAETNCEAGEDLLLEVDSNVALGLDLDGGEIPAEEVAFVSREEGGLLHFPGSGKPGPQIADTE